MSQLNTTTAQTTNTILEMIKAHGWERTTCGAEPCGTELYVPSQGRHIILDVVIKESSGDVVAWRPASPVFEEATEVDDVTGTGCHLGPASESGVIQLMALTAPGETPRPENYRYDICGADELTLDELDDIITEIQAFRNKYTGATPASSNVISLARGA